MRPPEAASARSAGNRPLRIGIVAANTFEFDARLLRTARALAEDGHDVTVLGWAAPGLPAELRLPDGILVRRLDVDRRLVRALRPLPSRAGDLLARLLSLDPNATTLPPGRHGGLDRLRAPLRRAIELGAHARRVGPWADAVVAALPDADVYHAKALIVLPVIRAAARRTGGRYVYDVADLHVEAARLARLPRPIRWLIARREKALARGAAGFTAVSDAIGSEAARRFGTVAPVVMLNCPPLWRPDELLPRAPDRLRAATGLSSGRPIILYQGGFSIDRGLEELVDAVELPALRELDVAVVLLGYGRLLDWLRDAARAHPDRVFVRPAVPVDELPVWTAGADLGYVGQPPRTLNQRLNLANKLFEYLMAGLPVLVAEGSEHCRLTTRESVGACCDVDSPLAIAAAASALLSASPEDRRAMRERCRRAALDRFNWDAQKSGLVALYRNLAAGPARTGSATRHR
jgi:glycosyltransferase involved in cell wall biosynthesis